MGEMKTQDYTPPFNMMDRVREAIPQIGRQLMALEEKVVTGLSEFGSFKTRLGDLERKVIALEERLDKVKGK